MDWSGEDLSPKKDGSIERFQITPGEGHSTLNDGAYVEVHLEKKHDEKVLETRDVSFSLGEGCESKVIEGVEKSLEKGEVFRLVITPKYAFGSEGNSELECCC